MRALSLRFCSLSGQLSIPRAGLQFHVIIHLTVEDTHSSLCACMRAETALVFTPWRFACSMVSSHYG